MAVYVDHSLFPYKRMVMCHMAADSLAELHEMACRIGVDRRHFQDGKRQHYDICKSKRALAVRFGAVEITPRQMVEHFRRQE